MFITLLIIYLSVLTIVITMIIKNMEKEQSKTKIIMRPDYTTYLLSLQIGESHSQKNTARLEASLRRSAAYLKKMKKGIWRISSRGEKKIITTTRKS